jgi:folate-binding protein YgfZ
MPGPAEGHDAYRAARSGASLFDRSGEARLRITGADRASWLQGLVTNDVAALPPGRGCYAAYLTPQGRMITDLRVLALNDAFLVDVPARTAEAVRQRFEMFIITEDVAVEDVTASLSRLALHGPSAARYLGVALTPGLLDGTHPGPSRSDSGADELTLGLQRLDEHAWLRFALDPARVLRAPGAAERGVDEATESEAAIELIVAASRELGLAGFDLYVPAAAGGWLQDVLAGAGASMGDAEVWDVLRLEAGTPVFGRDMDEETIPLEAGLEDRAISFTKGCYVGQEIIVRVMHRGHGRVARRLVGLAPADPSDGGGGTGARATDALDAAALRSGDPLVTEDGARDVGRITSAAWSPLLGHVIALGYVARQLAEPGTILRARHQGRDVRMVVREVPFVRDRL